MVTSLGSKQKAELDNLHIKYTWRPTRLLGTQTHSHLSEADDKAHMDEERLQEWRRAMYKIRNAESEIDLH